MPRTRPAGVRRRTTKALRLLSSRARPLPEFLVIGAQKAGTTSLWSYLAAHPGVRPAMTKEVHYFDFNHHRGQAWYCAHFPVRRRPSAERPLPLTGEATPYYLAHPLAPSRAAACVPWARLVVLVRDPIERAHSHWRMERALGREPLGFEDAIDAEAERLEGEQERIQQGCDRPRAPHQLYSYQLRGDYAAQLERWAAHFSWDQFLVVQAERLFAEPATVYGSVLDFLGLAAPPAPPRFVVHGAGAGPRELSDALRRRLEDRFRSSNARLAQLTGIDYSAPSTVTHQPECPA